MPSAKETNLKPGPAEKLSHKAGCYEDNTRIENRLPALHRPVDTQDFVFVEREALSTRAVGPPHRKRLPADASQNSSQSRIQGLISRRVTASKAIAVEYSLTGKDSHRSTPRYVPLSETARQGCEC